MFFYNLILWKDTHMLWTTTATTNLKVQGFPNFKTLSLYISNKGKSEYCMYSGSHNPGILNLSLSIKIYLRCNMGKWEFILIFIAKKDLWICQMWKKEMIFHLLYGMLILDWKNHAFEYPLWIFLKMAENYRLKVGIIFLKVTDWADSRYFLCSI